MAESIMDDVKSNAGKGKDWLKEKMQKIEDWAGQNTQDAKQKLIEEAREHGIEVNEDMDAGKIKDKIKNALKNKYQGNE